MIMAHLSVARDIVIRCDATTLTGIGHISRCINLASHLHSRGCQILFLCRCHQSSLHRQILSGKFQFLELPERVGEACNSNIGPYEAWLSCSQLVDAHDCITAVCGEPNFSPSLLIVDHYALDITWEQKIVDNFPGLKLLAIDDLANRKHSVDILLDSGRYEQTVNHSYSGLIPKDATYLSGPRYSLLSNDYARYRQSVSVRESVARVLVFYGGVDSDNWCEKALKCLENLGFGHLDVDVVLGSNAPHIELIRSLLKPHRHWTLHVGIPSLAPLIAKADLAIGAAGIHSWERASLGLPAVAAAVVDNQNDVLLSLSDAGLVYPIARNDEPNIVEQIKHAITTVMNNPDVLSSMSKASLEAVDCYGVHRIATTLLGPHRPLKLRPANFEDLGLYYYWANDPLVRASSLQSAFIPLTTHRNWFLDRLASQDALLYVLIDANATPLGQVRFERIPATDDTVLISFSLDQFARGLGICHLMLTMGIQRLQQVWGNHIKVIAHVKEANMASTKTLLRAGFHEGGKTQRDVRCFKYFSSAL